MFSLLRQGRFLPYFLTQFLGAFNDNVFKNALIIIIAFDITLSKETIGTMTNLSAGLFILPFFLFSAIAGELIDKIEKSSAMRAIKLVEILIMMMAAIALHLGATELLIGILFLMGAQSTFFGPAKYSYIPQHLDERELTAGNALVQGGTFVAILAGTMLGGILVSLDEYVMPLASTILALAILGYLASRWIPVTPVQTRGFDMDWNPLTSTFTILAYINREQRLLVMVLAISWFWFFGATYLVQLPHYTKTVLGGDETVVTLLLSVFTISVGAGSLLCQRFSGEGIETGLIPVGLIGLVLIGIDMYLAQPILKAGQSISADGFITSPEHLHVLFDIGLTGLFAGLYIVPLFAKVQRVCDPGHLSRVIAGNNVYNALFMVVASVLAMLMLGSGTDVASLLLYTSLLNVVILGLLYWREPIFFERMLSVLRISRGR